MGRNEKEEMGNTLDIVSELSDLALDRLLVCALLEKERRTWKMISELHPAEDAGQEAREIYLFLNALEMRHTQEGILFFSRYTGSYILDILRDFDGVRICRYGRYSSIELDVPALAAFCEALQDIVCHGTGRTWSEEVEKCM